MGLLDRRTVRLIGCPLPVVCSGERHYPRTRVLLSAKAGSSAFVCRGSPPGMPKFASSADASP